MLLSPSNQSLTMISNYAARKNRAAVRLVQTFIIRAGANCSMQKKSPNYPRRTGAGAWGDAQGAADIVLSGSPTTNRKHEPMANIASDNAAGSGTDASFTRLLPLPRARRPSACPYPRKMCRLDAWRRDGELEPQVPVAFAETPSKAIGRSCRFRCNSNRASRRSSAARRPCRTGRSRS